MKHLSKRLLVMLLAVCLLVAYAPSAIMNETEMNLGREKTLTFPSKHSQEAPKATEAPKVEEQKNEKKPSSGGTKNVTVTEKDDPADFQVEKGVLVKYTGTAQNIVIPNDLGITAIGKSVFSGRTNVSSVSIPEGVTEIRDSAFSGMTGLQTVTMPGSLVYIYSSAFANCTGMQSVTIPGGVKEIGYKAFNSCSGLRTVSILGSVVSIGEDAFSGTALESINLPDSVETIGKNAFNGLTGLTAINLGPVVKTIGSSAFAGTGLTAVSIPGTVVELSSYAFSGCSALATVRLGEGILGIGEGAFKSTPITSINWPNSLQQIGKVAFQECKGISNLSGASLNYIGVQAFLDCTSLASADLSHVETIGEEAFKNDTALASVILTDNLKNLNKGAFQASGLISVTLPGTIGTVAQYVLADCKKLTKVTMDDRINNIEGGAFTNCLSLSEINLPTSLTIIKMYSGCSSEYGAFEGCKALRIIDIPTSVTEIQGRAFAGCTALTAIRIPGNVTSMGNNIFKDAPYVTVYLGEGNTKALEYCKNNNIKYKLPPYVWPPETPKKDIGSAVISSIPDQMYNGREIKPAFTVTYTDEAGTTSTLIEGTDYTTAFSNNKDVGKAKITLTGIGDYTGTATGSFIILPQKVKLSSLKAGRKTLTVKWKKGSAGIAGYEIQYSLKKNFSGAKTIKVAKGKTSKLIKKLKSKKTYYVRIRAYKKIDGTTYYSEWSKVKSKKVK